MMRSYARIAIAVLAAGVVLGLLSRLPRHDDQPAAPAPHAATMSVAIDISREGAIVPERMAVPQGAHVTFSIRNQGSEARALALAGYDDRVRLEIPAGASTGLVLVADRPGDDFAWLVDGAPRGRLAVTGSHLVAGHQ